MSLKSIESMPHRSTPTSSVSVSLRSPIATPMSTTVAEFTIE
jgi:hypothetical protein